MTDPSLPVQNPPSTSDVTGEANVWGVLLAAGTSSRFGDCNKLLQDVNGEPMVRCVAKTLLKSSLSGVVVVVGHEAEKVRTALANLPLRIVENEAYAEGQSTSVRTGISAANENDADAAIVALGDMPYVSWETVDNIIATYKNGTGTAIAAAYNGKRGNPVLFDTSHFDELMSITGDVGGRQILRKSDTASLVNTGDPGVLQDVDRPNDWPNSTNS